jgi:8-oxo-dGTP diphosphatase
MFTVGAFAIIFNAQRQVLLCHRRDMDRWNLPGGGVVSGETPWQAVVREVQEEVGLLVKVEKLLGVYAYPPGDDIIFSFLCTPLGGEMAQSTEADAIAYFAVEHLPATTHLHHLVRITDAIDHPEDLHLKTLPLLHASEFSSSRPLPSLQADESDHIQGGQDALTKQR